MKHDSSWFMITVFDIHLFLNCRLLAIKSILYLGGAMEVIQVELSLNSLLCT